MNRKRYPSDLTDAQWAVLEPWIPPPRPGGRPRKTNMREVVNAIFYLTREGCSWRALPHDFPPWKTVYNYFEDWKRDGTWDRFLTILRWRVRQAAGRDPDPRVACIDSQSVKTAGGGEEVGTDGGKKVRGRKRHIVVDTMGLLLAVVVTAANVDDARAAQATVRATAGERLPAPGSGASRQQVPQPRIGPLAACASSGLPHLGGESSCRGAAVHASEESLGSGTDVRLAGALSTFE